MTLSISVKTASADLKDSAITRAITALASKISAHTIGIRTPESPALPDGPAIDVTFMLPGKLEKPQFSGMRMGGYEPRGDTLFFEVAVPEHILHSTQSPQYTAVVLQDVIANASDFFQDHQLHFNTLRWQQFINAVLGN
jgi:hypothetical protein